MLFFKKHAEKIKKTEDTLKRRGLPEHSYFHIIFDDNSERKEHDTNWSDISEEQVIKHFGQIKRAKVSNQPIKKITIYHDGKDVSLVPQKGEKVYQAVRSITTFTKEGTSVNTIVGRVVGRVKDGVVLEELFIDGRTGEIFGIRI